MAKIYHFWMGVPYGTLTAPAYLSLCKPLMLRTALKQLRILSERQKTRMIKSNNINLTNSIKKSIFLCIIYLYERFIFCCLFAYWLKRRRHLERNASHGCCKFSSDHVIFLKYLKTILFCIHLRSLKGMIYFSV
jgi:hypothetical protein